MNTTPADTNGKIVASAISLFSKRWYSSVSVAEICREAGVSNGIFYRYFLNKESLIRHILEDVITRIGIALEGVQGKTSVERLGTMASILVAFAAEQKERVIVFREGQYRFFEFEHRLAELYRRTLSKALGRSVGMPEYLFAIGGIRFAGVRSALYGSHISLPALGDMLANGIFPGLAWDSEKVFGITVTPPPLSLEENARERLLRSGKRLFGERGFHEVNIHEITDAADLSVGSFYKYFPGKEAFYSELIDVAGRQVRHFITANLSSGLNRLEREMQGIYLFGIFLSIDRWCYNIVREGEFVVPDKAREYYAAFERGYLKLGTDGLNAAKLESDPDHESTALQFLLGISHYYGIELLFDGFGRGSRAVVEGIGTYLSRGLQE
ncbi:MAG: TetR/AcrR family transcriptional regulator [Spirochaetales bacterium]|nr:MAG: TetR/AcrR family transcriptional regulator [Spirochaetales bacterium]